MALAIEDRENENDDLAQISVRIRKDQRSRLEGEQRARGTRLADVVRDNLDLAFAMKAELAKIVEGEFDNNDPANAPRLIHSLLFRVEERILAGLDRLAEDFELRFSMLNGNSVSHPSTGEERKDPMEVRKRKLSETVSNFISMIAENNELSKEVWLGAFLEIVPRIDLVGVQQLSDLEEKGKRWMAERGC